jgi:shikimate kinase
MMKRGVACGEVATVVDHIKPHRGDQALFWDKNNWQPLCTHCHASLKQSAERRGSIEFDTQPFIRKPAIPVTIVCGPAGSGKSTYVRNHAGSNDVVIDFDDIRSRLSGTGVHEQDSTWTKATLLERNRILRSLADDDQHDRAWFIVGAPEHEERELWKRKLSADVVLLDTPLDVCIQRINNDPSRVKHRLAMHRYARSWWQRHTRGYEKIFPKGAGYRSGTRNDGRADCDFGEFSS